MTTGDLTAGDLTAAHARERLKAVGCDLTGPRLEALEAFAAMVLERNPAAGLVSPRDAAALWAHHIVDSLSLLPYLEGNDAAEDTRGQGRTASGSEASPGVSGFFLDIGAGGGFPAIPLTICRPGLAWILMERKNKKADFLAEAVERLSLAHVEVWCANFPEIEPEDEAAGITARAVEKPSRLIRPALNKLGIGGRFLCQAAVDNLCITRACRSLQGKRFHVEHVRDAWADAGMRRGTLTLIDRIE